MKKACLYLMITLLATPFAACGSDDGDNGDKSELLTEYAGDYVCVRSCEHYGGYSSNGKWVNYYCRFSADGKVVTVDQTVMVRKNGNTVTAKAAGAKGEAKGSLTKTDNLLSFVGSADGMNYEFDFAPINLSFTKETIEKTLDGNWSVYESVNGVISEVLFDNYSFDSRSGIMSKISYGIPKANYQCDDGRVFFGYYQGIAVIKSMQENEIDFVMYEFGGSHADKYAIRSIRSFHAIRRGKNFEPLP